MTELVTALLWVLTGIVLGGLVVFAWHSDYVKPETHQAVIESGKAHREHRDEIIEALKVKGAELEGLLKRYGQLIYESNNLSIAYVEEVLDLRAQLAKVHSKRDPKTGRYVK